MKKVISALLVLVLCFALVACGGKASAPANDVQLINAQPLKVGFIYLHDENSTYDLNFLNAAKAVCEEMGIEAIHKTGIPEGNECYEAAAELADQGCSIVFADSFGHEDFLIQAAIEHPDVEFCHATGTKAHTVNLPNYHNAFAAIYEGRFLGGVAAGMKLNEMIESGEITEDQAKIGYIGAYPYAEVKSGYTSFFLGARYICPSATMEVVFTNSWYDPTLEKEGAVKLAEDGCVLISEHADSMGAPTECEARGIPFVFYNGSAADSCANSYIVASRIDWAPYFKYIIECVQRGDAIAIDWTGDLSNGSVKMAEINDKVAAAGTEQKLAEVAAMLESGTLKVFDTSTWTVSGQHLNEYMADVDSDDAYTPDTNVISGGFFHESEFRSAPYFDINIDGITILGD